MLYKAKVAVCSDIRTKHSTQSERHVEFFNFKPWWYVKEPLGVKRLNGTTVPSGPGPLHYLVFTITLRHTTVGRAHPDERSVPRTDLYPTTHDHHNRRTSIPPAGFEPEISGSERQQTHARERETFRIVQYIIMWGKTRNRELP